MQRIGCRKYQKNSHENQSSGKQALFNLGGVNVRFIHFLQLLLQAEE